MSWALPEGSICIYIYTCLFIVQYVQCHYSSLCSFHWGPPGHRYHCHVGTRVLILENVCAGTIQQLTVSELQAYYHIRHLHAGTEDSGYGAQRRYRGWTLASAWRVQFNQQHKCSTVNRIDSLALRIVAVRKSAGRFLDDPEVVYEKIRHLLSQRQTTIEEVYWCNDPDLCLAHYLQNTVSMHLAVQRKPRLKYDRAQCVTRQRKLTDSFLPLGMSQGKHSQRKGVVGSEMPLGSCLYSSIAS